MYLYFNEQGKLQTSIAHGSPVRQGDSVNLYVCFDLNYFTTNGLKPIQYTLFMNSKKEGDSSWSLPQMGTLLGNLKFTKFSDSEVTYKLKDGQRYITYLFNLPSSSGFTTNFGDIELVFNFIGSDNWNQYLQDAINSAQQNNGDTPLLFGQTLGSAAEKYRNLSAKIYVEPTYGKTTEVSDGSETEENFELFKGMLSNLAISKNIRLQIIQDDQENPTLELEARAREVFEQNFIFTGWLVVGMYVFNELNIQTLQEQLQGQIENGDLGQLGAMGTLLSEMVGQVNFTDEENNIHLEQDFYTIQSTDLYFITGYDSMLVINGKTGKMHTLINGVWDDVSYTKAELDEFFAAIRTIFGQIEDWLAEKDYADLTAALEDYFQRITAIETNAIYDIKYHNGLIQKKIGKDGNYIPVVSNDELRTDLGIENIEEKGTFGVEYTNNELKAKNGLNSEKTTLFTADSLKEDMNLDKVHNKASSNSISNNQDYVATVKAVYDYLERAAEGETETDSKFLTLMRKLKYLEQYLADNSEDTDAIVNKLEEVLQVFENLPEDINLFDNINNIFNKIGEKFEDTYFFNEDWSDEDKATHSIKGQIQELQKTADKNIMIIMRYENNQQLFTVTRIGELDKLVDKYPSALYVAEISHEAFVGAEDMQITFDSEVELSYISGAELDSESGTLFIYLNTIPEEPITIDTIKMISSLYHMTFLSTDALNQITINTQNIRANRNDINNLSRDKQDKSNLVNEWSSTPSQTKYPSEALVKSELDDINNTKLPNYIQKSQTSGLVKNDGTIDTTTYVKETNTYSAGRYIKTIENKNNSSEILLKVVDTNDYSQSLMSVSGEAVILDRNYKATANKSLVSNVSLRNGKVKIVNSTWESGSKTAEHTFEFDGDGNLTLDNVEVQSKGKLVTVFQQTPDDVHYPSEKLVKDKLDLKQDSEKRVSIFTTANTTDDTYYPSAKLVKDSLDEIVLYRHCIKFSTNVTFSGGSIKNGFYLTLENSFSDEYNTVEKLIKGMLNIDINSNSTGSAIIGCSGYHIRYDGSSMTEYAIVHALKALISSSTTKLTFYGTAIDGALFEDFTIVGINESVVTDDAKKIL